mmetsp:Transcript_48397/g.67246  ORF Transcript_48397/g.67246 Transcript_48397/m.67246 type:complete len:157 (-) Transcript_48397:101-571(-)
MNNSEAWSRMSAAKSGCDVLMDRMQTSTNASFTPSSTAAKLILGPRGMLEPPYSRQMVDHGKVVDSGRFGRWAIGHGSGAQYWDRGTPQSSRPPSAGAHEELLATNRSAMERFLPNGIPHETSFQRIWGRPELPRYTHEVSKHAPLVCTSAGIVRR